MSDTTAYQPSAPFTKLRSFGFRVAFCYLLFYAFGSGHDSPLYVVPKLGAMLSSWLETAAIHPAVWLAQNHFHVTGVGADVHLTGSGDTAIQWISLGVMLAWSLCAALVWTLLGRGQPSRNTAAWLLLLVRLTLVIAMANYGLSKLFPMQMPPPSLAVLNEPVGNTSPMTLLWTLIGLNPVYEMTCGATEVAAAFLLFFRRTALAGAILAFFVMSNVFLYNVYFDVPVKIYSGHLLLFAVAIITPDLPALWDFFWRHRPATSTPPKLIATGRFERVTTRVIEVLVAIMVLASVPGHYRNFAATQANLRQPNPFTGQWHAEAPAPVAGVAAAQVLTGDGRPMADLFLEPNGRGTLRDSAGILWRAGIAIQEHDHTFAIFRDCQGPLVFNFTQPDPEHLVLTPSGGDAASTNAEIRLIRVPLPDRYPLLERGFHFINEWPLER